MSDKSEIRIVQMNKYIKPDAVETQSKEWVLNGANNSFYTYIMARFNGSPTNSAIINSYVDLIYGQGLTNKNGNVSDFLKFNKMISSKEIRKLIFDFELFGEAIIQIVKANGNDKLPTLYHLPKQLTAPQKKNDDGEIPGYWYCEDWKKTNKFEPEFLPILDPSKKDELSCYPIRPYRSGKAYFSDPDYAAGLQYAEMEEEISNFNISHILNGLSFGYFINIPNGAAYTPEEKNELENKIRRNLTGSSNAGRFVINFNGSDLEITVTSIEVNAAHEQWQFLTSEARQQILTAHRVTSPMLFGIKDNTGLGNNANELDVAEAQLMKRIIKPKQQYIIDALQEISIAYGLNVNLEFIPLTNQSSLPAQVKMNAAHPVDELIKLGSDIDREKYFILLESEVDYETDDLEYKSIKFASTGTARPNASSEQDSEDIVIRYRYSGNPNPEREFCKKMMAANKLYRKEDIIAMGEKVVNPGFGMHPNPNQPYSIWLYKGGGLLSDKYPGGTCRHYWNRVIFLKKGVNVDVNSPLAQIISTAEARKKGYKVPVNENIVSIAPHEM